MKIAESRNQYWIYSACLAGIFMIALWEFIGGGRIVFEGMEAWQYFPVNMHYFESIAQGKYPFFDFLFSVGLDSLGDSQQHLMHPLKILLVLIGAEPVKISTYFMVAHIFIWVAGIGLYAQLMIRKAYGETSPNISAAFFAATLTLLSPALYINYSHVTFIGTLAYLPYMLLLTEKIMHAPKHRYFFLQALIVMLMLLVGNYGMQWIALLCLVMYLAILVFMDRRLKYRASIVLLAVVFGFFAALVQLVPTFDMMAASSRSLLVKEDLFHQSANPLQWLGYLSPGALYLQFKYAFEPYWSYTGNNVIEGVHYMGLIPLALFFYSFWKKHSLPREISLFHGIGLVMCLRALGVFSIINIVLNILPIFGQFRIPVRSFFALDFVLAMVSAYVLISNIDRETLRKVFSTLLATTFAFNLLSLLSIKLWMATVAQDFPTTSFLEYMYPFGGCLILLLARILVSESFSMAIDKKQLVLGLIILSIVDLGFHRLGLPLYWRSPVATDIKAQNTEVNEYCKETGASRIWMDFMWPNFALPHFPFTPSEGTHYVGNEWPRNLELHGTSCYFADSVTTSTLTAASVKNAMKWAQTELTHDEFLSFMSILGYKHYAKLKSESTEIIGVKDINVQQAPPPSKNMLEKFESFLDKQPDGQNGLFENFYESAYEIFVRFGISDWFSRHHFEVTPVPGLGSVFALTPPMYYIVLDGQGESLPYKTRGTFLILPEGIEKPVEVVYVPMGFSAGFIGSVIAFVLLLGVSSSQALRPLFQIYGTASGQGGIETSKKGLVMTALIQAGSRFLEFLVGSWLKKYGGIFLIALTGLLPAAAFLMTKKEMAFPFIFLIFLLIAVYFIVHLLNGSKKMALGATIFLGCNFLLGKIYFIVQSTLSSEKTQSLIIKKLPFLADILTKTTY